MEEFTAGEWKVIPSDKYIEQKEYWVDAFNPDNGEFICAIARCSNQADARLITEAKNMYEQLKSTLYTIHEILPFIPDGINDLKIQVNKHDLLAEATLIEDILTRIDGEQEV